MNTSGLYKFLSTVLFLLLVNSSPLSGGLVQGTVIATITESPFVENLQKGNTICGCDLTTDTFINTPLENIQRYDVDGVYVISTSKGIIAASAEQLFFEVEVQDFVPIARFKAGNKLLTKNGEELECFAIEYKNIPASVYDLTLPEPHLFFSSEAQVLTHNVDPVATPLLLYWGAQVLPVIVEAAITAGATIILAQGAAETFKFSSQSKKSESKKLSQHNKVSFWRKLKFWKKKTHSSSILNKEANQNTHSSPTHTSVIPSNCPTPDPDDDPNDPNKNNAKNKENIQKERITIFENNAKHIFKDQDGHFKFDTPQNRKLIEKVANDERNYLGGDIWGKKWYSSITKNGKQIWVEVIKNKIRNAGINEAPHEYNPSTGLAQQFKPIKKI